MPRVAKSKEATLKSTTKLPTQARRNAMSKKRAATQPSNSVSDNQQEIAGLNTKLMAAESEIERLRGVVRSQNEGAAQLVDERNAALARVNQILENHRQYAGQWIFVEG